MGKESKDMRNKKREKIDSKKYVSDLIDDILEEDDSEIVDYYRSINEELALISEEKMEELQDMEDYLNVYKTDIEETFYFIKRYLEKKLDKTGIYYTIKFRCKSGSSAKNKIIQKRGKSNYKIQDIIGARILLNFVDDISVLSSILQSSPLNIGSAESKTKYAPNEFGIMKTNYVWRMGVEDGSLETLGATKEEIKKVKVLKEELFDKYQIDETFEIQVRTSAFESYHEIDHDLRYKNNDVWNLKSYSELNRRFNGILATLETSDWAISKLIDDMAHKQYKDHNWVQMMQHRFKVRLPYPLSGSQDELELLEFCRELDDDKNYAHDIYKVNRDKLILYLWKNEDDKEAKLNYPIFIRALKKLSKKKSKKVEEK